MYTGLLQQIKSPNALRAVIAHELGHTIGGHIIQMSEQASDELIRTAIIQALGIGLMAVGGNASAGLGVMAGASGISQQSMLSFSRDEERIADDLGIDLMVKANQNPHGFIEVFEQMREQTEAFETKISKDRINHPLTTERLNNTKEKIQKLKHIPTKTQAQIEQENNEYELIRAKLIGYLSTTESVKAKYPSTDKSDSAIYARAILNMKNKNLDTAITGTNTLIKRHPKSPYFYELLGDIEYQYGHYDNSIKAYEKSLELCKNSPQIETALALVLSERNNTGDIERATQLCKHSILITPMPLTYWVLAKASTNKGIHEWAMAEYYLLNKDIAKAKKYAKSAKKELPKNSPEYIKSNDILELK
ncbi:MAG: M48 family metalloprotease [Alphaproteobacteria bacterium]|nr:M48 family metalloprotease [Alphaproteobacteria bacterium]